jgi:ABC-2 type transport system permease protein
MTAPLNPRQVVLLVARREFVSQVKSRGFVIGIVITIVLFGGLFLLSAYISSESDSKTLGVTQQTAALGPELEQYAKAQDIDLTVPAGTSCSASTRWTAGCRRSSRRRWSSRP